mmetsp:Transcript_2042/g.3603  ORF Transcript_2042/g.3603 Transcript_2042/m.3603 type:complete len:175 (-) Transcript_2042:86-610(-)
MALNPPSAPAGFEHLSEEDLAKYAEAFAAFDQDAGGSISTEELGSALRCLGHAPTNSEIARMIDDVDIDGNGELDFGEFVTLLVQLQGRDPLEELLEAFKIFDRDRDGTVSVKEMCHVLVTMGEKLPKEEVEEWFIDAQIDETGCIDIQEFIDQKFIYNRASEAEELVNMRSPK